MNGYEDTQDDDHQNNRNNKNNNKPRAKITCIGADTGPWKSIMAPKPNDKKFYPTPKVMFVDVNESFDFPLDKILSYDKSVREITLRGFKKIVVSQAIHEPFTSLQLIDTDIGLDETAWEFVRNSCPDCSVSIVSKIRAGPASRHLMNGCPPNETSLLQDYGNHVLSILNCDPQWRVWAQEKFSNNMWKREDLIALLAKLENTFSLTLQLDSVYDLSENIRKAAVVLPKLKSLKISASRHLSSGAPSLNSTDTPFLPIGNVEKVLAAIPGLNYLSFMGVNVTIDHGNTGTKGNDVILEIEHDMFGTKEFVSLINSLKTAETIRVHTKSSLKDFDVKTELESLFKGNSTLQTLNLNGCVFKGESYRPKPSKNTTGPKSHGLFG